MSKEDIQVSVDCNVLRINVEKKAEKEEEKEEAGRKYHRWAGCRGRGYCWECFVVAQSVHIGCL